MNKNSITASDGNSTKELIVDRANLIINSFGMVDFRIDNLAKSLNISPGNITYHFPRKDDISLAIWMKFVREVVSTVDSYITPFIDIKQLYLFFRNIASVIYSYRGVVSYMLGDCGVIEREKRFNHKMWEQFENRYDSIMKLLTDGDYIKNQEIEEGFKNLFFESQITTLLWWINHALSSTEDSEVSEHIDFYALVAIYPIKSLFTAKGDEQYMSIKSLVDGKKSYKTNY
ncbi:MAG: TetR/AcrR family transcriptional regulator [Rikenellaceae bacterium]